MLQSALGDAPVEDAALGVADDHRRVGRGEIVRELVEHGAGSANKGPVGVHVRGTRDVKAVRSQS